ACSRDPLAQARLNRSAKGAGTGHSPRHPKCGTTQSDRLLVDHFANLRLYILRRFDFPSKHRFASPLIGRGELFSQKGLRSPPLARTPLPAHNARMTAAVTARP